MRETDPIGIIVGELQFEDTINFCCVLIKVLVAN
jgi:hypothetical protein